MPYNEAMETIAIIGGGAAGLAAAVAAARATGAAQGVAPARAAGAMQDVVPARATRGEKTSEDRMPGVSAAPAREAHGGIEVVVFEADERVGRSILATGNGRCNFSNAHVEAGCYRNAAFVAAAFGALEACCVRQGHAAASDDTGVSATLEGVGMAGFSGGADEGACGGSVGCASGGVGACSCPCAGDPVHAFFAELGLMWREEGEGRLYPLANKASSVLDVLRAALARWGVRTACERRATRIDAPERPDGRYHVRFADGSVAHARSVIVATGGRTARDLLPGGLPFVGQRSVLGPLRTDPTLTKPLNNIRVRCASTLVGPDGAPKAAETGEVLFRDYGVSGIAVFNLSRFAEPGDLLLLDLLPQLEGRACESELRARYGRLGAPTGEELLTGVLLPAVARAACKQAGLRAESPLGRDDVPALARALKAFPLEVRGVGDARQCQVTRGGFAVEAFDPATMEARALPGLFVVGEALDVDAPCGGHNLHWAWASGLLAGAAAAKRLAAGTVLRHGAGAVTCHAARHADVQDGENAVGRHAAVDSTASEYGSAQREGTRP